MLFRKVCDANYVKLQRMLKYVKLSGKIIFFSIREINGRVDIIYIFTCIISECGDHSHSGIRL